MYIIISYMGLYLRKKLENKAEISVWQITETEQELIDMCSVPTDEMEEISLIRSESLRKQKLAVRALLNEVFEEKVYLSHHDNGKPYLENCVTNISITHTEKYVAIITHDEDDLGIDIESLDRDFSAVRRRRSPKMRSTTWTTTRRRRTSSLRYTGARRRPYTRECRSTASISPSR